MGNLTTNFSRSEFACGCGCGFDTVDAELLGALERIRDFFGAPVAVTSACRCPAHNAAIKPPGSENSQHLSGRAADIKVKDVPAHEVADYAESLGLNGVGRYMTFTHIDTRSVGPARW